MNTLGAIQRAELFADVEKLKAFKKEALVRNMELVKFETTTARDIANVIEGCMRMIETDTALSDRMDHISARIDIVNKRLRKLEEINGKLQTQMSMIEDAIVNDPRLQDE